MDVRQESDVWFEPGLVFEILSAELTLFASKVRRIRSHKFK